MNPLRATKEQIEKYLFPKDEIGNFTSSQFSIEIFIYTTAENIFKTFLNEYADKKYYEKGTTEKEIVDTVYFLFWEELKIINYDSDRIYCEELEGHLIHNDKNNIENKEMSRPDFSEIRANLHLISLLTLAGAYVIDCIDEMIFNPMSPRILAHLTKASYYLGFAHGTYSKQLERSLDGLKAKKKQHENTKKQNDINRNEVIKLWNSRHWNSFSQCAEHIYDNNLLPFKKGYRHIEALVSSVAKECKGTNSHPICTK